MQEVGEKKAKREEKVDDDLEQVGEGKRDAKRDSNHSTI